MKTAQHLLELIEKGARAHDLDLRGADLGGVELSKLRADDLDLRSADLRGATLRHTRFGGCRLEEANLENADWSQSTLRVCALDRARAVAARFDETSVEDTSVKGTDLTHASLRGAKLTETSFERAVLREATLENAEGAGVEFRGADLHRASFRNARFLQPDFRGADLTGANFSGATLKGADFRGAILNNVIWEAAALSGARFDSGIPIPGEKQAADVLPTDTSVTQALEAVQDLLRHAIADPRLAGLGAQLEAQLGQSTPVDPRPLLESLRHEMQARGADVSEVLQPFEQALAALQSAHGDEPPEEWKPILEPLMKAVNEGRQLDLNTLLKALMMFTQTTPLNPDQTRKAKTPS